MDVGKKSGLNSYGCVALLAALASSSLLAQPARADHFQWFATVAQAAACASVTQADSEPEAIFIMTPEQPVIGVPFRVDASQSFDRPSAGPIASYVWSWGDGTANSSGVSVLHTYAQAGRFTLKLTVTDADAPSNSSSTSRSVVITSTTPPPDGGNHAPTAALSISPAEGDLGEEFTFDASGSSDADSDPLIFRFNFGDGNETEFTSDAVVTHEYEEAGTFNVRLTVRDDSNASIDLTSSVSVLGPNSGNLAPVALIATGPRTGAAPVTLSFDGRISYDPDGGSILHAWEFVRNGQLYDEQTGSLVNQLFDQPGTYSVFLTVIDSEGASDTSDTVTVTITERDEPVEPPPPAPIPEPEDPPPSYTQRPPAVCGVGALMPLLAGLLGFVGKRRFGRRNSK